MAVYRLYESLAPHIPLNHDKWGGGALVARPRVADCVLRRTMCTEECPHVGGHVTVLAPGNIPQTSWHKWRNSLFLKFKQDLVLDWGIFDISVYFI